MDKALKLADEIEQGKDGFRRDVIVTMLRQQQAEIKALREQVAAWEKAAMDCRVKLELQQCTRYFDKAQEK